MSGDVAGHARAMHEVAKDKMRKQMHHDLCVLCAGNANGVCEIEATANRAMAVYKALWLQVMKEIP